MADIDKSLLLRAPLDLVWGYLSESDKIAQWLMPNDFRAEAGHAFTMRCAPMGGSSGVVEARVVEIDPPRRLVYSWTIDVPPLETLVTIDLSEEGGATRLVLVHSGWEALAPADQHVRQRHEAGWDHMLGTVLAGLVEAP